MLSDSDFQPPRRRVSYPQRLLAVALLLVGCSTLLGVEDTRVQGTCTTKAECAPGFDCLLGACRDQCASDQECGDGARCLKAIGTSACIPANADCGESCPEGTKCVGQVCRSQCSSNGDCAGGQECQSGVCVGTDKVHDSPISTGGAGGGTAVPSGGTAGTTDMGGTSAGSGELAGAAGADIGPVCVPGHKRCQDLVIETCISDAWTATGDCPYACTDGECTGQCVPDTKDCSSLVPRTCLKNATYELGTACPKVCEKGECVDRCTKDALQCNNGDLQKCGADGQWALSQDCLVDCVNEKCTECAPPAEECKNGAHRTCGQDGTWGTPFNCQYVCVGNDCGSCSPNLTPTECIDNTPQYCDATGEWKKATSACSGDTSVCLDGTCVECQSPAKDCYDASTPMSCQANGFWKNGAKCMGSTAACLNGSCVACAPGTKGCADADTLRSCLDNGVWQDGANCSGSKSVCSNGACVACTGSQKTCINGDAYICSSESWSLLADCSPPSQICKSGVCAANNPYSVGFSSALPDPVSPANDILYLQKMPALSVDADLISLGMIGRVANVNAFGRFVIYSDNAGAPGAYLARTGDVSIKAGFTEDVPIPLATKLSAGKTYWVGAVFTGGATTYGQSNAAATPIRRVSLGYGAAFPDPFSGGSTLAGVEWNFYITVRDVSQ